MFAEMLTLDYDWLIDMSIADGWPNLDASWAALSKCVDDGIIFG